MPVQVDVTVQSTPTTTSVETESTKTTSNVTLTGPQGPPGTGLIDGGTYWASNRNFLPNESGIENLGAGNQTWGNLFSNTGYFNDLTVSGALNVSGDFNIGDSQTDTITTQGDLYVQDDAFFGDEVVITGALSAGNVLPRTHDTYNLGSPTYRWANIYAKSGHFADNTIVIGTGGAQISVTGDQIRLKGNTATAGTFFDGSLFLDGGTLTTQKPEGAQFKILNTNATNGYEFALDDDGNLGVSGSLSGDVNFSNNVSVNTNGYLGVPVGTTAQRPGTPANGMIRLNTTNSQFEGYHSSNWQGLGGVIDVDRDTYVSTEKTSDDDTLYFYTADTERARIESNGNIKLNSNTFINNDLTVSGNLSVSGNFTLGDTTTDSITSRGDLRVLDDSYFADSVTVTGSASFKSGVDIEKDLTVSGNVTASDPTQNGHLSTKSYVDSADSNLQTQITNNDSDITALQTATGSLQTQVSNNDSDISALNTATGSLQSQITSNDTDISNINTNINNLLGGTVRTTGVQTVSGEKTFAHKATFLNDIAVSGNFTLGDTTADRITSKGDLYVDDAAFVKTSLTVSGVTTFEGNVIGQAPTQNSHFTTKSYVDTEVAAFQAQITSNDNELASLHTATGSLQSQVTSNDTDISTLNTATGSLQSQVASNDTDITNLETATGSLQTQVNSNDSEIAALNTATGSLQSQVTSNDTDINDLSGKAILNTGDQTISGVKTFAENVKVLGDLSVSGSFTLGDETTDQIITRGDLIVEDTVNVTGDATFNGSVGIGTDSPTAELHITDAATPQMKIQDTTNNVVATVYADNSKSFFGTDSSHPVHIGSNGASHISVENDGNVGVSGNFSVASSQSFHFYATNAGETRAKKIALGQAVPNNNALNIQPHDNSTNPLLVKTFGGATSIVVDASNQVGIGTSSPDKKLHVAGDFKADGEFHMAGDIRDNRGNLVISQSAANISQNRTLTFGNANYSNFNFTTNITYNAAPVNPTDLTNKSYVDGLNANALLVTGGAQTVTGDKTFVNNLTVLGDLGVSGDFTLGDANTDSITTKGDLFVQDDAVFSDTITVTGLANFQGSVGVGTSSPTTDFHVSTDEEIVAVFQSSDNGSHIQVRDDDSSVYLGAEGSVGYLGLNNTLSANNLNIKGGSIGIGTTSPSYKIHIKDGYLYTDKNFGAAERTEVGRLLANATSNGGGLSIQANISATASERYSLLQSMDSDGGNRDLSLNNFGGNVGIGTLTPSVKLDINSTDAVKLPVGTTAQRPTAADGMIRLNTTTNQFEGYQNSNWQGLGGVIDVDQDTYVSTEKSSDDDTLFFYTAGGERAKISSAGHIFTSGNLTVSGTLSSTQITNLNTATGSLQTQVTSNDTDISALQTATGSLQTQVTANDTDISALNTATGSLQTQVTANDTDISALNTATGSLQTQVTANDTDISALQTATGSLQTQVTSNDTDISALNTATGSLQTQVTSNDTDISALNTATGVLDSTTVKLTGNQTIAGVKTFSNNAIFNGDLTVNGTTMTVDTSNVLVEDPVLLLAKNQTGSASLDAGFIAERGDDTNVGFIWDESDDHFAVINTTEAAADADITIASYANFKSANVLAETYRSSRSDGDIYIQAATASDFVAIGTQASANLVRIQGDGNVGIGTTSPTVRFHVNSSTSDTVALFQSSDSTARIQIADNDTQNYIVSNNSTLSLGANNTTHAGNLNIASDGKIGIGTITPSTSLDISGTDAIKIPVGTTAQRPTAANGMIRLNTTTNQFEGYHNSNWQGLGGVIDVDQDTYVSTEKTSDDDTLFFYTAGSERARILSDGKVGIGTTSPNRALHVAPASNVPAIKVGHDGTQGNGSLIEFDNGYTQKFYVGMSDTYASRDFVIAEISTGSSTDATNPKYVFNGNGDGSFYITDAADNDVKVLLNTNGDSYLDGGNVGIGTNNPSYNLDIYNSTHAQLSIDGDTTSQLLFGGSTDNRFIYRESDGDLDLTLGGSNIVTFEDGGSVGIGTTTPSNTLDINGGLEVNGESYIRSTSNVGLRIQTTDQGITNSDGLRLGLNGTHAFLWVYEDKPLALATNGTERATILGNGNFGIGTTSPDSNLDIEGTGSPELRVTDTTNTVGAYIQSNDTKTIFGSRTNHPVQIEQNAGAALYIDTSKNVGIGTTSPESLLHLRGSIPTLILHDTNSSVSGDDYGKIQWHTQDSSMPGTNDIGAEIKATDDSTYGDRAAILFSTAHNATSLTERMRIASNGNVGIGTATPGSKLHVVGEIFAATGSTSVRTLSGILKADTIENSAGASNLKLQTEAGGNKHIEITPNGTGNVGIATSSPTAKLHVNGDARIGNPHANEDQTSRLIISNSISGSSTYDFLTLADTSNNGSETSRILFKSRYGTGAFSAGQEASFISSIRNSTSGAYHLAFGTTNDSNADAVERVRIASTGSVGIGTSTPSALLHVDGTLTVASTANFGGSYTNFGGGYGSTGVSITSAGNIQANGTLTVDGTSTFHGSLDLQDNDKILLGAGNDLEIFHDGSDSYIKDAGTGTLRILSDDVRIMNAAGTEISAQFIQDGEARLKYDNVTKLATKSYGADITGRLVTTSHIDAPDNARIRLGDGDDLQLYHDGSNSWITNSGTGILIIGDDNGDVRIRGKSGEESIVANDDGAVELYHDNSKKLETTSAGVSVTGDLIGSGAVKLTTNTTPSTAGGEAFLYKHASNGTVLSGYNASIETGSAGSRSVALSISATSNAVFSGDVSLNADNKKIKLGASDDLQIYHNGSDSIIADSGTGGIKIDSNYTAIRSANGSETAAKFLENGAVELYYDNSKKLETTSGGVTVTGLLTATTKSFTIDHPTKPGKKLRHGSLEGPENGVYIRGKSNNNSIELPEYWTKLVDEDSITVQLTAIGKPQQLYVERIDNNIVYVQSEENRKNISQLNYYYLIHAERIDVDKLQVEIEE